MNQLGESHIQANRETIQETKGISTSLNPTMGNCISVELSNALNLPTTDISHKHQLGVGDNAKIDLSSKAPLAWVDCPSLSFSLEYQTDDDESITTRSERQLRLDIDCVTLPHMDDEGCSNQRIFYDKQFDMDDELADRTGSWMLEIRSSYVETGESICIYNSTTK